MQLSTVSFKFGVKGREEEKRENARNLKRLGVLSDIISQATGLSKNQIEEQ